MDRLLKIPFLLLSVFFLGHSPLLVESLPSVRSDHTSPPSSPFSRKPPPLAPPLAKLGGNSKPSASHHGSPPPHLNLLKIKPPPASHGRDDQQRQIKGTQQRKINLGKKIGVMFLGIAVAMQILIVGVLGFKRWQISKMKSRRWDFSS